MACVDAWTCPQCQGALELRSFGPGSVRQCAACESLFLPRAEVGALVEAENDWHRRQSNDTAQLPRITSDMSAPPPVSRARSFVESLFRG